MIWNRITRFAVAAGFVLVLAGAGSTSALARFVDTPSPGSDLANDVQAGESGEKAVVNDVDKGAEFNIDDGQVQNVDETDNGQTGSTAGSNS